MGEARRKRLALDNAKQLLSLDRMFDRLVERFPGKAIPSTVYHYTSWAGAEGILKSRELWFTAHDCTNDPGELVSVDETIVRCARELLSEHEGNAADILKKFVDHYDQDRVSLRVPVFLFCLTASRDDPHFWQSEYTDRGAGLCLGFKFLPGEKTEEIPGLGGAFIEVDYDETSWKDKLLSHFRMVIDAVPPERVDPVYIDLAVAALNRIAAFASIQGKQASWADEKELRFAVMTTADCEHPVLERESRGRTIRYIKLPIRPEGKPAFLDEVIIGPKSDPHLARTRLHALLESAGYPSEDAPLPTVSESRP